MRKFFRERSADLPHLKRSGKKASPDLQDKPTNDKLADFESHSSIRYHPTAFLPPPSPILPPFNPAADISSSCDDHQQQLQNLQQPQSQQHQASSMKYWSSRSGSQQTPPLHPSQDQDEVSYRSLSVLASPALRKVSRTSSEGSRDSASLIRKMPSPHKFRSPGPPMRSLYGGESPALASFSSHQLPPSGRFQSTNPPSPWIGAQATHRYSTVGSVIQNSPPTPEHVKDYGPLLKDFSVGGVGTLDSDSDGDSEIYAGSEVSGPSVPGFASDTEYMLHCARSTTTPTSTRASISNSRERRTSSFDRRCSTEVRSGSSTSAVGTGLRLPYATFQPSSVTDELFGAHERREAGKRESAVLCSCNGSCRSLKEEEQLQEIRKLRRKIEHSQQKLETLTTLLVSKDQTISTYEQNFNNMRNRLQALNTSTSEKDAELQALRSTIAGLRRQSGIPPNPPSKDQHQQPHNHQQPERPASARGDYRRSCDSSGSGFPALDLDEAGYKGERRSGGVGGGLGASQSFTSLNSGGSGGSGSSQLRRSGSRKGWLRSSLGRAFRKKSKNTPERDAKPSEDIRHAPSTETMRASPDPSLTPATVSDVAQLRHELSEKSLQLTDLQLSALSSAHQVEQLREQVACLRADKDRLGQLLTTNGSTDGGPISSPLSADSSSSSPAPPLPPSIVGSGSQGSSRRSMDEGGEGEEMVERGGMLETLADPLVLDHTSVPAAPGRRIPVCVPLRPTPVSDLEPTTSPRKEDLRYIEIGCVALFPTTTWPELETALRRLTRNYAAQIDPSSRLGLTVDSMSGFQLDGVTWPADGNLPLPLAHIDRQATNGESPPAPPARVVLKIRGGQVHGPQDAYLDLLAFETLVPRTILQRYVALVLEHRKIMLCGPSGTGKTYLANRLAEFLAARNGTPGQVARFKVEHKSSKELRAYLASIAEQTNSTVAPSTTSILGGGTSGVPTTTGTAGSTLVSTGGRQGQVNSSPTSSLPCVIIIDNLHHVTSLADIFTSFLSSVTLQKCPYIIGTMNQATFSANNLQLHHNFRWVLCANHMEPVRGFLGRYLRRKLVHWEVAGRRSSSQLATIVAWIPRLWQTLNDILESHASSDVTIGPRLFLSCPMDVEGSQVWFTDLWNYSLIPYLLEAVREGLQTFGRRVAWCDPLDWILNTWPWISSTEEARAALLTLRPEDVGYEGSQAPSPITGSVHQPAYDVITSGVRTTPRFSAMSHLPSTSLIGQQGTAYEHPPSTPRALTTHTMSHQRSFFTPISQQQLQTTGTTDGAGNSRISPRSLNQHPHTFATIGPVYDGAVSRMLPYAMNHQSQFNRPYDTSTFNYRNSSLNNQQQYDGTVPRFFPRTMQMTYQNNSSSNGQSHFIDSSSSICDPMTPMPMQLKSENVILKKA